MDEKLLSRLEKAIEIMETNLKEAFKESREPGGKYSFAYRQLLSRIEKAIEIMETNLKESFEQSRKPGGSYSFAYRLAGDGLMYGLCELRAILDQLKAEVSHD